MAARRSRRVGRGAVDMRLRPPLRTWVKQVQFKRQMSSYFPGTPLPKSAQLQSIDQLMIELDEANIELGVIMGRKSAPPFGSIPNDEIAACVRQYAKRFVGWGGIDVSRPIEECLREIKRCIQELHFKGISIEPGVAARRSFYADDRRIYPIYDACVELDIPLSITLSASLQSVAGRPYEYSSPLPLYRVAKDFPKLDIHLAHGAYPWVMETIGVLFVCKNIWLSPDLYMTKLYPGADEFVKAANGFFQDRTLFGTAYPSTKSHRQMVREYERWSWMPGVQDKIMYHNALRLMRMV